MKKILAVVSLFMMVPAFASDLSFHNFVGKAEITSCLQTNNGADVPPTGFCDISVFKEVEIRKLSPDSFMIIFTDLNEDYAKVPELSTFHREDATSIEDASFVNTQDVAIWTYSEQEKSSGRHLFKKSYSLFYHDGGVPSMVVSIYNGTSNPPVEVKQFFKLKAVR